ncbi:MAG: hypothetical protein JWO56_3464 [Acidobacteria bacterium]|nr:hypothetical protein [Acidobacteriota bacterium]
MDGHAIEKLANLGVVEKTSTGKDGIRVSLQDTRRSDEPSRELRRAFLLQHFQHLGHEIGEAEIDLDSLSVSGQSVLALLPADRFEDIEQQLRAKQVRIDLDVIRNAV